MGQKRYTQYPDGTIEVKPGINSWGVDVPDYVYDLWLPLIGSDAIGVYAVYCRLQRDGEVYGVDMQELAHKCRKGIDALNKINELLDRCAFIEIERPTGWQKLAHYTTKIRVFEPSKSIPPDVIDYLLHTGRNGKPTKRREYETLSPWLVEVVELASESYSGVSEKPNQDVVSNLNGYAKIDPSLLNPQKYAGNPQDFHAQSADAWKDKIQNQGQGVATDRDSTNKKKIAAKDVQMPEVGRLVFQILTHTQTDTRNLTQNQVDSLLAEVICDTRLEPYPSPQTEYEDYPVAFEQFCKTVHKAAWFTQPGNKITPGNVIRFLRGYNWDQGWFAYRPGGSGIKQATENTEDDYQTRLNRGDFDER